MGHDDRLGRLPAPQATLMSTIIKGLLGQNLPWGLVLVGVFIAVTLELCGIHSLSFAVGSYLPIATTAPIFAGGLVRAFVERRTGARKNLKSEGNALQLRIDRGRIARRHPVRRALVGTGSIRRRRRRRDNRARSVPARGNRGRWWPAVCFSPALAVIVSPHGDAQSRIEDVRRLRTFAAVLFLLLRRAARRPRPPARRLTTLDAVRQFPGYFHLQNVLLRGEFAEERRARVTFRDGGPGDAGDPGRRRLGHVAGRSRSGRTMMDVGRRGARRSRGSQPWSARRGAAAAGDHVQTRSAGRGRAKCSCSSVSGVTSAQPATTATTPRARARAVAVRGTEASPWSASSADATCSGICRPRLPRDATISCCARRTGRRG